MVVAAARTPVRAAVAFRGAEPRNPGEAAHAGGRIAAGVPAAAGRPAGGVVRMILGMRVGAIVAAGGSGQRAGLAKQWLELGGETVLRRSARLLAGCPLVDELVLVVPPGEEPRGAEALAGLATPGRTVAGGPARADSVANGLAA